METDLRRPLVWGAVNHWNTDNPHVHVVVRGLDADGHDLTIDGRYIREGLRSRAETMLTYELGPRTPMQIDDQLAREVGQDRFTSLDRALHVRCGADGGLLETSLPARDRVAMGRLIARLGHLERLGLVARVSAVEWRFEPGWDATLRELGQTGDVIKRMHAAVTWPDPARFAIVDESSAMDPIDGVVRSKGLHDELTGQLFMVIEAADSRICYTRVDLQTAERIAEGVSVRLAVGPSPLGGCGSAPDRREGEGTLAGPAPAPGSAASSSTALQGSRPVRYARGRGPCDLWLGPCRRSCTISVAP